MKKHLTQWAIAASLLIPALTGCGKPEPLTPAQITEHNKPGTVMIQTVHQAKFSVPDYALDDAKLNQFAYTLQQQVAQGQITSEEQAFVAIVQEVLANPLRYFAPLNERIEQETELLMTGSALVVTADGYLVTNAHVVSSEQADLKEALAFQALEGVATSSCQQVWDSIVTDNFQAAIGAIIGTQEFLNLCLDAHAEYYAHYMHLDSLDTQIYAAMGSTALNEVMEKGYLAKVQAEGEPTPGKDVAVLKIEANSMPTVALGSDENLVAGDRLFILGYPGASVLSEAEAVEPSLTAGLISARKTMPDGWEILQTDAAMSSGNSGGPVFNEVGEVIGIATFGKVDPNTGSQVQGANFVIPISVVEEFLAEAQVEPALSDVSKLYRTGIQQFEREQFRRALETFRQVSELNPNYPYVQSYLTKTQSALQRTQKPGVPVWAIALGGSLVLMLGVGGTYGMMRLGVIKRPAVKAN